MPGDSESDADEDPFESHAAEMFGDGVGEPISTSVLCWTHELIVSLAKTEQPFEIPSVFEAWLFTLQPCS